MNFEQLEKAMLTGQAVKHTKPGQTFSDVTVIKIYCVSRDGKLVWFVELTDSSNSIYHCDPRYVELDMKKATTQCNEL